MSRILTLISRVFPYYGSSSTIKEQPEDQSIPVPPLPFPRVYDEVLGIELEPPPLNNIERTSQPGGLQSFPPRVSSTDAPAASGMGHPAPISLRSEPHIPKPSAKTDTLRIEKIEGRGKITVLEESMPRGIIDGSYFFDKASVAPDFKRGDKVEFRAQRSVESSQWEVTYMKLLVTLEENEKQSRRRFNTVVGIVVDFQNEFAKLKYGTDNFENVQDIPFACLPRGYEVLVGDYLRVTFEIDSLEVECSTGRILSVEPSKTKTVIGKVTTNKQGVMAIDSHIYFDHRVCKRGLLKLHSHDVVRAEAIESRQDNGRFVWRAISIEKSNFPSYTASQKQEEGWLEPINVWSDPLNELLEDKFGVNVRPRKVINFGALKIGSTFTKAIDVENGSNQQITLKSVTVRGDQSVCKFDVQIERREADDIITILDPGGSCNLKISCTPTMLGSTRELCILNFESFRIGRYLVITCLSDQEEILDGLRSPEQVNVRKWRQARGSEAIDKIIESGNRKIMQGAPQIRAPFFLPRRIPPNTVPKFLWEIVKKEDEDHLLHAYSSLCDVLTFKNYREKFQVSLWLEEMQNEILRRQYDMDHVLLRRAGNSFAFEVPGLKDFHPPILIGDPLSVFDNADPNGAKQQGHVEEIRGTELYAKFSENFQHRYDNTFVTIQFSMGRTNYKRAHYAVEQAIQYLGEDWLFPTEDITLKPSRIPFIEDDANDGQEELDLNEQHSTSVLPIRLFRRRIPTSNNQRKLLNGRAVDKRSSSIMNFKSDTLGPSESALSGTLKLKWFNKLLNVEQKDAVRRILRGQGRPLPYIIFGPPGTGKTVTVVESILQIYTLDSNSRILVSAPSNSAADIIAQHMVSSQMFLPGDFVRLVGFLRQECQIPENIRDYCTDGDHLDTVARNRIIITTCTTAGQFFSLGLDTGHFTHVFIDEAGYCTEPEALISSALVAFSMAGQVILAGDPQQLGPVLMSQIAVNCGLSLSFLERLMALPLYSRNEEKFPIEKYNPVVLTKLIKNYRAHPTLLKLPSMLFYDDELESAAAEKEVNLCHSLDFLPRSGVPLLFHGLQGSASRESDSPSWYNAAEIIQVVEYVRKLRKQKLENDDIGIITPYRKQVEKIRKALELGLLQDEIPKVGSVEEFQGGERKVMIMSLVRSGPEERMDKLVDRMSFVYSAKRFNVAITRAKSVLIVIGNPHLLSHDENWDKFLRYCLELGCYTGCNIPFSLDKTIQNYLTHFEPNQTPLNDTQYDSDGELVESEEDEE